MISTEPEILIDRIFTVRTLIVFARQRGVRIGVCIHIAKVRRIFVSGRKARVRDVVQDFAEKAVDTFAEEYGVGILCTEGCEHVACGSVPAYDTILP